jgi:hypothetical protein
MPVCYKISIDPPLHKEMLMPRLPIPSRHSVQLALLPPPGPQPTWQSLPPDVRQATISLLVHLLHQAQREHAASAPEVDDE